jgi:hypothetical protein
MLDMTEGGGAEGAGDGTALAMTPMLFKGIFEEKMGPPVDAKFFGQFARVYGRLIAARLSSMAPLAEGNKV